MNVSVNGEDISRYIESIKWSGDENQLARKVSISYLYAPLDPNVTNITVQKGNRLVLSEDGYGILFDGIVLTEERTESSVTMTNTAYDYAWYLRSKVVGVFTGSPAAVTQQVCAYLGVSCGSLYDPGGEVEVISTGEKTGAQAIQDAYSGHDAHIYMHGTSVCTEKYGQELAGTVTGDDSVTDASYQSSAENLVNRVLILDAADHPVGETTNGYSEYGTVQETYKMAGDGTDPLTEASKLLQGIADTGKVVVVGNPGLVTGKAVIVERAGTKIRGRFAIISDDHSITDASYSVTLGLRFEEVA